MRRPPASPTLLAFAALAAGLALGALLRAAAAPAVVDALLAVAEPIGTVWVNAIRMTLVPLVVALLIRAVVAPAGAAGGPADDTRADDARVARLGVRAAIVFALSLAAIAALVAVVTPPLVRLIPAPDAATLAALRAGLPPSAPPPAAAALPSVRDWLVALVPTNPVKAAADGALLPLVVFTLLVAAAATRIAGPARAVLGALAGAVADALLVVVRWVLALAPVGVLALALPLGARAGSGAAGALAGYVAITVVLCALVVVALDVAAVVLGRVPLGALLRAAAPAQAVAAGTRSSLAALPAMLRGVDAQLALAPAAAPVLLPLAVATYRAAVPVAIVLGAEFLAHLYAVPLTAAARAGVAASAVLVSLGVPGVPAGVFLVLAPVLAGAGIPAEGVALLIAVDPIPDAVRTLTNVTGHVAATAIVGRRGS